MSISRLRSCTVFLLVALSAGLPACAPAASSPKASMVVHTIPARPEDVATLEGLMRAFYETVNIAPDAPRQWDRDRTTYLPGARIVAVDEKVSIWDHQGFVEFAEPLIRNGFRERELVRRVRRYGNIANIESSYESRVGPQETISRGVNYIQTFYDGQRWWITGLVWQTEDAAHPIPADLLPSPSPAAQATPRAGVIQLAVDARDAPRKMVHAKLTVPANPGPLTLLYPKWIPGEHGPTGPIVNLTGLRFSAGGKPIPWERDPADMYVFHCTVPAGAQAVEIEIDALSAVTAGQFTAGPSMTSQLADVSWNHVVLYPKGVSPDALTYRPSLRLPRGWKYATALQAAREAGDIIEFAPVSLTTLIDSPAIAGAHFKEVDLGAGGVLPGSPHHLLDVVADSEGALTMAPEHVAGMKRLVGEAHAIFGSYLYRDYRFLCTLSDDVPVFGLEHHESSDNRFPERAFRDERKRKAIVSILPHEFVHSWNGKYRRPAGLATSDYQEPMKGDLLWSYEGLTDYLGIVLTARSGLWSAADFRENLAFAAASMEAAGGRSWRSLHDTSVAAQVLYPAPPEWASWRRSADFYLEGDLLWLEVDMLIRTKTGGKRSLDDFTRRFYGGASGAPKVARYTLDDVVTALGDVVPHDWRGFWAERTSSTAGAPLNGIAASGWRLVYTSEPNEPATLADEELKQADLRFSVGLVLKDDGTVLDVAPGTPAAKAGLAPGMKLAAVGGRRYAAESLLDAIRSKEPIELLVQDGAYVRVHRIDYRGGLRYPHLERDASKPDRLGALLAPRLKA
ncbi:M61 family peptidase [Pendulispora brunnea]|uniref:M61 family peptidase n=1 Tax=Pendulispora brunnea TaxID=2905690 RepID=A0ABZ2JVT1_9BACT